MTQSAVLQICRRIAVATILGLSVMSVNAQIRRVAVMSNSGQNMASHSGEYMDVYDYDVVDSQPHFPGGDCELIKFINRERRYPAEAYDRHIEGRVLCSFVVNVDGSISNISVMRGVEASLDKEAVRVIDRMPRWIAGRMGHHPVPVYCILPIAFRL
jgi:TonB family protein